MNEQLLSQLERLSNLRASGAITDAEFEQQKAALLATPTAPTTSIPPPVLSQQAAPKKMSTGKKWAIGLGVFLGFAVLKGLTEEKKPAPVVTSATPEWTLAQQATNDSIERVNEETRKLNSDVELAPRKAARAIKRQLKDPDSFDEIDHKAGWVKKKGVYISCVVQYRAKNSFGGMAIETAQVDFNTAMEPIRVKQL